jgi:glycosyltransferase involved in cell wall biosynthesis
VRVAFLDHTAQPGGGELALLRTLDALQRWAPWVEPTVIVFEHGDLVARAEAQGVRVEVLPLGSANDVTRYDAVRPVAAVRAAGASARHVARLVGSLRRIRPHVVHTNSMKAHVLGGLAARAMRTPLVWHLRDRLAADYLPAAAVRGMQGLSRVLPTMVVANSQATAVTLPGSVRHVVIPSPISLGPASPEPEGPFTVGCVGRLAGWKGQHVLVRAFADAFPASDARLLLVGGALFGEKAYEGELRALVGHLGLDGRVEFAGHVDDIGLQLGRMHVVVHCSTLPEPFGQVVIEAMAAGRAVVASDAGGPAEVVEDGVTGLLTPPGDVHALAAALARLESDGISRRHLADAARLAVAPYGPQPVAAALGELYRSIG